MQGLVDRHEIHANLVWIRVLPSDLDPNYTAGEPDACNGHVDVDRT